MTIDKAPAPRIGHAQYSLYRMLFGGYLTVHFAYLLCYAAELFSNQGMLPSGQLSPLFSMAPSLFRIDDSPLFVQACLGSGVLAAVGFTLGFRDRSCAAWMLLLLISLLSRNPLIANPALPYVGFMLLLHCCVPVRRTAQPSSAADVQPSWSLPPHLFLAATAVLAISYSYSGYTKLLSPGWVSGDTVGLVLQNPLARDWVLRDVLLTLPNIILQIITWSILCIELLFAPLYLLRKMRFVLWASMLGVQFGFLLLLRFPDLTIPMLLFHLLTFDPRWIPARPLGDSTLHYDGNCGICHRAVQFALTEIPETGLSFRPMQRDTGFHMEAVDSWQLDADQGQRYFKTDALVRLLTASGGSLRVVGVLLRCVPATLRNAVYDCVAKHRRQLTAAPQQLCPLVPPQQRDRFK